MDWEARIRNFALGTITVSSLLTTCIAPAQQVTGTLGQADANTIIDGKQIPPWQWPPTSSPESQTRTVES